MDLLLDMDNVLTNFDQSVVEAWDRLYPTEPLRPPDQRQEFFIDNAQPEPLRKRMAEIYRASGFFRQLKAVAGSQEAVQVMLGLGWHVSICTAPLSGCPSCLQEKHDWLLEHFGKKLADQMIIVRDKTLIRGDILIDDRPSVTGLLTPVWEHVIYDYPYNRHSGGQRRLTWENWRSVLQP